ncbi:hypothetical protein KJ853_04725, partial [Patescibacteria group bacterium]|nr:hypothetical protein [Patescibacteria group bacterium]
DNAGGTESNGASGKCTVTYELGDPSWNTGSDDFRVYATSTLAWSEGPEDLVCSASLTDDNSSAVSCGSGSISANTQYRVQVLLKNSGYASLKMNGIYEIIGHMDVKGGWAGASPTLGLSCQFRDVGFDNGATTCAVAWSGADFGSNDVFITNTDAGDVVIAPGATEGFMYMITTDSSEVPESNQTSYWDTPFICGGDVTGLDDGQTYGTVLVGSQCWMTRNLGASQVATAYDDTLSYGDYYQWGRLYDGHQISTSGTTNVQASNYVPGHSNFIYSFTNWLNPAVETLWQAPSYTNNPCPSGWHVPTGGTVSEWATAMANTPDPNNPGYYLSNCSSNCLNSAASSILKLPAAGYRNYADATLYSQGTYGYYWSSSPDSTLAYYLNFDASFVTPAYNLYRVNGFSVRCVRN